MQAEEVRTRAENLILGSRRMRSTAWVWVCGCVCVCVSGCRPLQSGLAVPRAVRAWMPMYAHVRAVCDPMKGGMCVSRERRPVQRHRGLGIGLGSLYTSNKSVLLLLICSPLAYNPPSASAVKSAGWCVICSINVSGASLAAFHN